MTQNRKNDTICYVSNDHCDAGDHDGARMTFSCRAPIDGVILLSLTYGQLILGHCVSTARVTVMSYTLARKGEAMPCNKKWNSLQKPKTKRKSVRAGPTQPPWLWLKPARSVFTHVIVMWSSKHISHDMTLYHFGRKYMHLQWSHCTVCLLYTSRCV